MLLTLPSFAVLSLVGATASQTKLQCWGISTFVKSDNVPADALWDATDISAAGDEICALKNGALTCWGDCYNDKCNVPTSGVGPVLTFMMGSNNVCAQFETIAPAAPGTVLKCWGATLYGATTVPAALEFNSLKYSCGGGQCCGVDTSNIGYCWGQDHLGQATVPADLGTVNDIHASWAFTCAITTANAVRCWGDDRASTGIPRNPTFPGPVQKLDGGHAYICAAFTENGALSADCVGGSTSVADNVPKNIASMTSGKLNTFAAGGKGSCFAINQKDLVCKGGTTWCGTVPHLEYPVLKLATGYDFTCGLLDTSTSVTTTAVFNPGTELVCWGDNVGVSAASVPPSVKFNTKEVSASDQHTVCAIGGEGQLACWGCCEDGQCAVPTDVGPARTVSVGSVNNVCGIFEALPPAAAGTTTTRCWGHGSNGAHDVPAALDGTAVKISTGGEHACVVDGSKVPGCWGLNNYQQATIPGDVTTVEDIEASWSWTCVIKETSNALRCWGGTRFSIPDNPTMGGPVLAIESGVDYICAVVSTASGPNFECKGRTNMVGSLSPPATTAGSARFMGGSNNDMCFVHGISDVVCQGGRNWAPLTPTFAYPIAMIATGQGFACTILEVSTTTTTSTITASTSTASTSSISSTSTTSMTISTSSTSTATTTSTTTITSSSSSSSTSLSSSTTTTETSTSSTSITSTSTTTMTSSSTTSQSSSSTTTWTSTSSTSVTTTSTTTVTSSSTTSQSSSSTTSTWTSTSSTSITSTSTTTTSITSSSTASQSSSSTTSMTSTSSTSITTTSTTTISSTSTTTFSTTSTTTFSITSTTTISTTSTTTVSTSSTITISSTSTTTVSTSSTSSSVSSSTSTSTGTSTSSSSRTSSSSISTSTSVSSTTSSTVSSITTVSSTSTASSTSTRTGSSTTTTKTLTTVSTTTNTATTTGIVTTVSPSTTDTTTPSVSSSGSVTTVISSMTSVAQTTSVPQTTPTPASTSKGSVPTSSTATVSTTTTVPPAKVAALADTTPGPKSVSTTGISTSTPPNTTTAFEVTDTTLTGTTATGTTATDTTSTAAGGPVFVVAKVQEETIAAIANVLTEVEAEVGSLLEDFAESNRTTIFSNVTGGVVAATKLDFATFSNSSDRDYFSITVSRSEETPAGEAARKVETEVKVPRSLYDFLRQDLAKDDGLVLTVTSFDEGGDSSPVVAMSSHDKETGSFVTVKAAVAIDLSTLKGQNLEVNNLTQPITFSMPVTYTKGMMCAFWDEEKKLWSTDGVSVNSKAVADGDLICDTWHLSLFGAIFQGFLDAFLCSQLTLFNSKAFNEMLYGDWKTSPGSLLFWLLLVIMGTVFGIAAYFDWRREQRFNWSPEFFLLPRDSRNSVQTAPEPLPTVMEEDEEENTEELHIHKGFIYCISAKVIACVTICCACCRENALRDAVDEIVSEWFENFGELRTLCESIWDSMEIGAISAGRFCHMSKTVMSRLVLTSSRRLAAASMGVNGHVVNFVLDDQEMRGILMERHARRSEEIRRSHMARREQAAARAEGTVVPKASEESVPEGRSDWRLCTTRNDAWAALHEEVCDQIEKHVSRVGWWALPYKVWVIFSAHNPLGAIFAHNIFMSCKMMAFMRILELSGELMVLCIFFDASGSAGPKENDEEEECGGGELSETMGYKLGRILAIATGSILLAGLPVMLLHSLHTRHFKYFDTEGCPKWHRQLRAWKIQDAVIWVAGSAYLAFALLFICLFLANIDVEGHTEWTETGAFTLFQDAIVVPLSVALIMPMLCSMLITCISVAARIDQTALIREVHHRLHESTNVMLPIVMV